MVLALDDSWSESTHVAVSRLLNAALDWNRSLDALIDIATSFQETGQQIDKDRLMAGHYLLV